MDLKDEFFNSFVGVDKDVILYVVNNLTPEQKRMLNEVYGKTSEVINNSTRKYIMNIIFKDLYKKPLKDYIATSGINIVSLINTLKPLERELLLKEYTIDKMEPIEVLTSEELDRNKKTIEKLKDSVRMRRFNLSRKKSLDTYKLFFDCFSEDKQLVTRVVNTLSNEDIDILQKRFGSDYTSLYMVDDETQEIIRNSIMRKLKRELNILKNGGKFVTIFDFVKDTRDIEVIKLRINSMDAFGESYIYNLFGSDLSKEYIVAKTRQNGVIRKVYIDILNGSKENKKHRSLVEIFAKYKGDQENDEEFLQRINSALKELDKYDRFLFNRKYVYHETLTRMENEHLKNVVLSRVKIILVSNVLDVPTCKCLFDRFNEGEKTAVLYYIDKLFNNEEKDLFRKKFGYDFSRVSYLYDDIDDKSVRVLLNGLERQFLKDYKEKLNAGVKMDIAKIVRVTARSEEYNDLRYVYGDVLALAIVLYVRYKNRISFDDIEKITGIKEDDVIKYSGEYLNISRGR